MVHIDEHESRTTDHLTVPPGAVVVAFDGSAAAREAVHWAAAEAVGRGRPLRLVHALSWPGPELAGLELPPAVLDPRGARQAAASTLALAVRRCREEAPGIDVAGAVLPGDVVALVTVAVAEADLLVLGACGQTDAAQVLLGSSADRLVRTVARPVVVVRDRPARDAGPVVIGVDGSPASEGAVRFGFDVAARRGHDVVAVHAWSDVPLAALTGRADLDREEFRERAAAVLATRIADEERRYRGVRVQPVPVADHPAPALLEHAPGAALLVVGRHGRAGSASGALGSVSHAVAAYARCPVAVVGAA